jgi:hypothetical protein
MAILNRRKTGSTGGLVDWMARHENTPVMTLRALHREPLSF